MGKITGKEMDVIVEKAFKLLAERQLKRKQLHDEVVAKKITTPEQYFEKVLELEPVREIKEHTDYWEAAVAHYCNVFVDGFWCQEVVKGDSWDNGRAEISIRRTHQIPGSLDDAYEPGTEYAEGRKIFRDEKYSFFDSDKYFYRRCAWGESAEKDGKIDFCVSMKS